MSDRLYDEYVVLEGKLERAQVRIQALEGLVREIMKVLDYIETHYNEYFMSTIQEAISQLFNRLEVKEILSSSPDAQAWQILEVVEILNSLEFKQLMKNARETREKIVVETIRKYYEKKNVT